MIYTELSISSWFFFKLDIYARSLHREAQQYSMKKKGGVSIRPLYIPLIFKEKKFQFETRNY